MSPESAPDIPVVPDELAHEGERLGSYVLLDRLGRGGLSEVWRARNSTGRKKALKILLRPVLRGEHSRFKREAETANAVDHPGIVKVDEVGVTDDSRGYLVMDVLEGRSFHEWLREPGRNALEASEMLVDVLRPLVVAHAAGIVHRDIKPENVFVLKNAIVLDSDEHQRVKVLDFGLAKDLEADGSMATREGAGTPAYMSPEQAKGEHVSAAIDVWATGVMLYEILTGLRPFRGKANQIIADLMYDKPVPPVRRVGVPDSLAELAFKCLRREPRERPKAADLLAELRDALNDPATREQLRALRIEVESEPGSGSRTDNSSRTRDSDTFAGEGTASHVRNVGAHAGQRRVRSGVGATVVLAAFAVGSWVAVGPENPPPVSAPVVVPTVPAPAPEPLPQSVPVPRVLGNAWVSLSPPSPALVLGLARPDTSVPLALLPGAEFKAPVEPYDIQQHEVTWSEIEPWLRETAPEEFEALVASEAIPDTPHERERFPVTGLSWTLAKDYCRSLDANLPSEAELEFAARGPELRRSPWGDAPVNVAGLALAVSAVSRANAGPDITPEGVWNLTTNAQEWTRDIFRGPTSPLPSAALAGEGRDTSGRSLGTIYAVRGVRPGTRLPASAPWGVQRSSLCGDGCSEGVDIRSRWLDVGFRCVRPH